MSWSDGYSIGLWDERTRHRIQPPLVILLLTNHIFIWQVDKAFSRKWREEEERMCGRGPAKPMSNAGREILSEVNCRDGKRNRDRNLEGKRTCSKTNSSEFVRRDGENIAQTAMESQVTEFRTPNA